MGPKLSVSVRVDAADVFFDDLAMMNSCIAAPTDATQNEKGRIAAALSLYTLSRLFFSEAV
ncbi:hypothetical protein [Tardiphaga sp.]|jgi:hypothetical protein|uniref:hypothetical protein n=1 Tax=Tardiphaga sp. TaxID=1926292 RepID=UPI0037D9977F